MKDLKTKHGIVRVDDDIYISLLQLNASVYLHHRRYVVRYREQDKFKEITSTSFITGKNGKQCNVGFKDGDCGNCLRSNLVLGNRAVKKCKGKKFFGVNKNKNRFQARISISDARQNVITVGTYLDEVTAAIAYNKAMDIVYGIDNYIMNKPNMSKDVYDEIYNNVSVDIKERSSRQGTNQKLSGATSIYTGVCKAIDNGRWCGKWVATIFYKTKNIYLGRFSSEESAAQAYNKASVYLYGEDARQNDVPNPLHHVIDIAKLNKKIATL